MTQELLEDLLLVYDPIEIAANYNFSRDEAASFLFTLLDKKYLIAVYQTSIRNDRNFLCHLTIDTRRYVFEFENQPDGPVLDRLRQAAGYKSFAAIEPTGIWKSIGKIF